MQHILLLQQLGVYRRLTGGGVAGMLCQLCSCIRSLTQAFCLTRSPSRTCPSGIGSLCIGASRHRTTPAPKQGEERALHLPRSPPPMPTRPSASESPPIFILRDSVGFQAHVCASSTPQATFYPERKLMVGPRTACLLPNGSVAFQTCRQSSGRHVSGQGEGGLQDLPEGRAAAGQGPS